MTALKAALNCSKISVSVIFIHHWNSENLHGAVGKVPKLERKQSGKKIRKITKLPIKVA